MIGEIIKEYLVSLGVTIDKPGFGAMETTINRTSGTIQTASAGWAKNFVTAGGIIATAIAGVTASVAGLMAAVAKQDLEMEKYARRMMISKNAAFEMKHAIDALGESIQDIQITPELFSRYKALVTDGRKMKVGGDYESAMKGFRDLAFEFTRLKQEASYAMQWVGYYLMKYLSKPLADAKKTFKSFNDNIIKNMPAWTEKTARVLVYIINIGRHFWDLLKSIGKTVRDVWEEFPRGIKIASSALTAFFALLKLSPIGRMVALVGSLLLLADDYFGYMEGKQAALGPVWDKLNEYLDTAKQKINEWGRELAPVWDKFVEYLIAAKDGAAEFAEGFMTWIEKISKSEGMDTFIDTAKRLGKSLYELGDGVIEVVVESFRALFESFEKYDTAKIFSDLMEILWDVFVGLVDIISDCAETVGKWLKEIAKSETVKELIDAVVDLGGAIMELFSALTDLCKTALSDFFKGVSNKEPMFSFRDAVKIVVDVITGMTRAITNTIRELKDFFEMMKDNYTFKKFWDGMGEVVKGFTDLIVGAVGAVGKLGLALLELVNGNFKKAANLAKEAFEFGNESNKKRKFSFDGDNPTGELSAPYESNGDPGAFGNDSTGGWSYGTYQITEGTMGSFLDYLGYRIPEYKDELEKAGPVGSAAFTEKWQEIARIDPGNFGNVQKEFITDTHYAPQVEALKEIGIDLNERSKTLKEVVWSMAVQMGGYTKNIFKSALEGRGIDDITDEELIPKLYEYRKQYFSLSTPDEREAVFRRYDEDELPAALEMLRQEKEYAAAPPKAEEKEIIERITETVGETTNDFMNYANTEGEEKGIVDQIVDSAKSAGGAIMDYASELEQKIKEQIPQAEDEEKSEEKGIVDRIVDSAKSAGGTIMDYASGLGQRIKEISAETNLIKPSSAIQSMIAGADPGLLQNITGLDLYRQSSGDITNITYQIDVGGVKVENTNASPQDIGRVVAEKTLSKLNERADYILKNRTLGGGTLV